MSATNGHVGAGVAVTAARPVALIRYHPGVVGETARTVHVVALPTGGHAGAVGALCGTVLSLHDVETVTPGEGMPCTVCVVTHATGATAAGQSPAGNPADGADAGLAAGGVAYQPWDWPVTVHHDQVRLSLYREVSATAIPILLCTEVVEILTLRSIFLGRCAPR